MASVLLVDDDVELVEMLKEYLEQDGFAVHIAHDGTSGLLEALSNHYDIAVLDVMMPRLNGVETLRRLRESSRLPVIMLTAKGDDADRILGLELGADDYVPKPCTPRELSARIRAILRRSQLPAATPEGGNLVCGPIRMWPRQRRATLGGAALDLTSTQFNLLEVLLRHAGQTVNKNELSEQALGRPLARFDRSIDVHMSSLRQKLGALPDGRSSIQTVHRQGYMLIES